MHKSLTESLGKSLDDANILYQDDWASYSAHTGYKISADSSWRDQFNETFLAQKMNITDLEDLQIQFQENTSTVLTAVTNSYSQYQQDVKGILDLAIGDVDKFFGDSEEEGTLAYYLTQAQIETKKVADEMDEMGKSAQEGFSKAVNAAKTMLDKYGPEVDNWVNKTKEIGTAVIGIEDAYSKINASIETTIGKYEALLETAKAALKAM
jgi:methyl-accepting chemotaxis protein